MGVPNIRRAKTARRACRENWPAAATCAEEIGCLGVSARNVRLTAVLSQQRRWHWLLVSIA